jgi:hypothetical protein
MELAFSSEEPAYTSGKPGYERRGTMVDLAKRRDLPMPRGAAVMERREEDQWLRMREWQAGEGKGSSS